MAPRQCLIAHKPLGHRFSTCGMWGLIFLCTHLIYSDLTFTTKPRQGSPWTRSRNHNETSTALTMPLTHDSPSPPSHHELRDTSNLNTATMQNGNARERYVVMQQRNRVRGVNPLSKRLLVTHRSQSRIAGADCIHGGPTVMFIMFLLFLFYVYILCHITQSLLSS